MKTNRFIGFSSLAIFFLFLFATLSASAGGTVCNYNVPSLYQNIRGGLVLVFAKKEEPSGGSLPDEPEVESALFKERGALGAGGVYAKEENPHDKEMVDIVIGTAKHLVADKKDQFFVQRIIVSENGVLKVDLVRHPAVVLRDLIEDEAWVKITLNVKEAENFKVLEIGDWITMKPGTPVVAFGHPLGFPNSMVMGNFSHVREKNVFFFIKKYWLQHSAFLAPGYSGGPLVNACTGKVVGINSFGYVDTSVFGASPLDKDEVPRAFMIDEKEPLLAKAWLGVYLERSSDGVLVIMVSKHLLADNVAGIKSGDVILALNGKPLGSPEQFYKQVLALKPGEKAELLVKRNGDNLVMPLVLSTLPDYQELAHEIEQANNIINKTSDKMLFNVPAL